MEEEEEARPPPDGGSERCGPPQSCRPVKSTQPARHTQASFCLPLALAAWGRAGQAGVPLLGRLIFALVLGRGVAGGRSGGGSWWGARLCSGLGWVRWG